MSKQRPAKQPQVRSAEPPSKGRLNELLSRVPGIHNWNAEWESFQSDWREWSSRLDAKLSTYCLPDPIIKHLRASTPSRPTFLSAEDADAELAFTSFCHEFNPQCVGVWLNHPINFPVLNNAVETPMSNIPNDLAAHWAASTGKSEQLIRKQVRDAEKNLNRTNQQLLGYCGWLMSDDDFRHDLSQLRNLWKPSDNQGSGIGLLKPPTIGPDRRRSGARKLSGRKAQFWEALDNLCRKWSLCGFATWDLPLPQGPLDSHPAELVARIRGPEVIVDHFPPFFDIPSSVDLRKQTRDRQANDGKLQGVHGLPITKTSPRAGNLSEWANLFRVYLIEHTVEQRYGQPRGIVSRLVESMSKYLNIGEARVRQLHQRYRRLQKSR